MPFNSDACKLTNEPFRRAQWFWHRAIGFGTRNNKDPVRTAFREVLTVLIPDEPVRLLLGCDSNRSAAHRVGGAGYLV